MWCTSVENYVYGSVYTIQPYRVQLSLTCYVHVFFCSPHAYLLGGGAYLKAVNT